MDILNWRPCLGLFAEASGELKRYFQGESEHYLPTWRDFGASFCVPRFAFELKPKPQEDDEKRVCLLVLAVEDCSWGAPALLGAWFFGGL